LIPLLLAIAVDFVMGEPPQKVHPVVAMGRALTMLERHAPTSRSARFLYGTCAALVMPIGWGTVGHIAERSAPMPLHAMLLKSAMASRSLLRAGARVETSLRADDILRARTELRALVSRPTQDLDEPLIASAAIESLSENLVDSWIAPLLAYAIFGLGGAYFYRAANTADAMWGYHTPDYEWLGKSGARLDDLLNWFPARLSACLLVACGRHPRQALQVFLRDRGRTSSPNAGQAMAACAGQLGVRLEKAGYYVLNAEGRAPAAQDIAHARYLVARAMLLGTLIALLIREVLHG
jgi:adenosylcobinamide-phosphate synthase